MIVMTVNQRPVAIFFFSIIFTYYSLIAPLNEINFFTTTKHDNGRLPILELSSTPITHPRNSLKSRPVNSSSSQILSSKGKNAPDTEIQTKLRTEVLPRPHPRAGAKYSNGTFGYVADPSQMRKKYMNKFNWLNNVSEHNYSLATFLKISKEEFDGVCNTTLDKGDKLLFKKVVVNGTDPEPKNTTIDKAKILWQRSGKAPRILCVIYTYPARHHHIEAIIDTWGWRCDGFIAASTITNDTIGVINIPHRGPEHYMNMWQKVRSIWLYIYDNYIDEYDFFWLGGDDVFLIIENLRNYLWSLSNSIGEKRLLTEPLFLGALSPRPVNVTDIHSYHIIGGGGYVVNRVTLSRMGTKKFLRCNPRVRTPAEDKTISVCLSKLGIVGNDTVDSRGEQRFHFLEPHRIATFDGSYAIKRFKEVVFHFWGLRNGFKYKENVVSSQTISFHRLVTSVQLKRAHAILHHSCPSGTIIGDLNKIA